MKVYIANFGKGNYAWEDCRQRSTIATMNDADVQPFWFANDRDGYVAHCAKYKKTARGDPAPTQLASRWFNLMTIISESEGDLWIHRNGDDIWWTKSLAVKPEIDQQPRDVPYQTLRVFECHKPCEPWQKTDLKGKRLTWSGVHAKAKDFLTTESTLQELSLDYASYVITLVNGEDLRPWHDLPLWKAKLVSAAKQPVHFASPVQTSVTDMAIQAMTTAANANGQTVERTTKIKNFGFSDRSELERYLHDLLEAHDSRCALSGVPLQFKGSHDDSQLLCSLDRINSNGDYERGNIQVVCRFINRWKSDMEDNEFRRLLGVLLQTGQSMAL
jgi:hypothetical protein